MTILRVKEAAQERGYNQDRLMRDTGLSLTGVSNYWHNKVRRVDLDALDKIAAVLDCDICDLLQETDKVVSVTRKQRRAAVQ